VECIGTIVGTICYFVFYGRFLFAFLLWDRHGYPWMSRDEFAELVFPYPLLGGFLGVGLIALLGFELWQFRRVVIMNRDDRAESVPASNQST